MAIAIAALCLAALAFVTTHGRTETFGNPDTRSLGRDFVGLHMHRAFTRTPWPDIGFGSWRLWDAYVQWAHLEPQRGKWDFRVLDKYVAMSEEKGVKVLLPLGLTPRWASARPDELSSYQAGWAAEPAHAADWQKYVRTIAERYLGRIHEYEIWNEPNHPGFFTGGMEAMLRLSCEAYSIIKNVDPSAIVVSPAPTHMDEGVEWLDAYLEKGGGRCADVIGFHFYLNMHEPPEHLPRLVNRVREVLKKHHLEGMPIWNTESGWQLAHSRLPVKSRWHVVSADEAPGLVGRALVLGAASGLKRFFWYAWDNETMGAMIEPDTMETKDAGHALGRIGQWLDGAVVSACTQGSSGVWSCNVAKPATGMKGWIAWHPRKWVTWRPPIAWGVRSVSRLDPDRHPRQLAADGTVDIGPSPSLLHGDL